MLSKEQEPLGTCVSLDPGVSCTGALVSRSPGHRLTPRELIHITPTRGTAIGAFDIGDLVAVSAGASVRGGFSGAQRVYEYTISWDEDGPFELSELQTSSDQEGMLKQIHCRPTRQRKIAKTTSQMKDTRQKPLAFRWWEPECVVGGRMHGGGASAGERVGAAGSLGPLEMFAFRLHADGAWSSRGTWMPPVRSRTRWRSRCPVRTQERWTSGLANDQYWHTTITTDNGTTFFLRWSSWRARRVT